ncbi:DJ-1/PfpI family protein [Propionivibrio soli]|uniref:DJ-1/PfpI family protein n=1 Tax=Propionivibrio soli TaxID=2976531 RepID=UPI0021E89FDA|nr:DJ-1/PfpI family protein [Propionivibrio soli]
MRSMFRILTAVAALALAACGPGVTVPPFVGDPVALERDKQVFVEAMKPRNAGRPVIAVLALNEGTETTDFLLTHAVLKRADVADVRPVALHRGRVRLYPALEVEVAEDLAEFDRKNPAGADYVIVPAMVRENAPEILAWLRQQADRGARIIGVCVGGVVVGEAGLLDGRRFTGHWFSRKDMLKNPGATYVPHRRYVADRGVATTTGITASIPTMLAVVEAIGGPDKAASVAAEMGVASWAPAHDSTPFALTAGRMWNYVLNKADFWNKERWDIEVPPGGDDTVLALTADAWERTGRTRVEAVSESSPVKLRSGLALVTQPATEGKRRVALTASLTPMKQLNRTLCEIGERYGASRREWVMLEMEYAQPAVCSE